MSIEQIGFYDIPSDVREKLLDVIEECRKSKVRILSENDYIKEALKELRPNGGSSMHDRMKRVEARVDEIYSVIISK